jgi:hypothetical protein
LEVERRMDGFWGERKPNLSYGKSDVIDGFSYRLPIGVDFLGE